MKADPGKHCGHRKVIHVGTFRVVSGRMVVSDPCYEIGTGCQGVLENVRKGRWMCNATVACGGAYDMCVAELAAWRGSPAGPGDLRWKEESSFAVGVDSGQAGIFDMAHYRHDRIAEAVQRLMQESICPEEPWYSLCCDRTFGSEMGAGIVPYGVVSSSGIGDGAYRCFTRKDRGSHIIGVRIVFITDVERKAGD